MTTLLRRRQLLTAVSAAGCLDAIECCLDHAVAASVLAARGNLETHGDVLHRGNSKLGPIIHTFSLPAVTTCPGRTARCEGVCYADRGYFYMANVQESLAANHAASLKPNFVAKIVREIKQRRVRILRIHVSGDFYGIGYARKWVEIAQRCRSTVFKCNTRSWRRRDILPGIRELSKLPNTRIWLSADAESHEINGKPPQMRGARVAYMVIDDDEFVPAYADVVLRDKPQTIQKYRQGRLVCPAENGIHYPFKMTCSDCGVCYRQQAVPKKPRDYSSHGQTTCAAS